ncbi:MAG: ABC transporter ATP-binding protein, partial [Rhizobiaceae bacterium]|nr:ABC transporter ATP-binding protein [Rhizobiaceae bacterium]
MINDLELIKVGKVYDDGTQAVAGFDLTVGKGEFVAFLGPSGCGKTTTLRMIAGFETITSGDILIKGRNVSDLPPEKRPTSMISQNYALFPHMNVAENVAFGLRMSGMPRADRERKTREMLAVVQLSGYESRMPSQLSGGQQQRVALARA